MESWEVVRHMVPRGTSHIMARMMRVTSDYVRRWRKPAPEHNEDGTGFRNPIDNFCDFIEGGILIDRFAPKLAIEYVSNFYRQLINRHEDRGFAGSAERRDAVADLLASTTVVVNTMNLHGCTMQALVEVSKLIEAAERVRDKMQVDLGTCTTREQANVASITTRRENEGGR